MSNFSPPERLRARAPAFWADDLAAEASRDRDERRRLLFAVAVFVPVFIMLWVGLFALIDWALFGAAP